MRTQIILARKHGQTKFVLTADPSVAINDQTEGIRELLCAGGVHEEFAELQVWDSTHGLQRTLKFHSPAEKKADDERIARENKAQQDSIDEMDEAKKKKREKASKKEAAKPEAPAEKKADDAPPATQEAQEPVTDL